MSERVPVTRAPAGAGFAAVEVALGKAVEAGVFPGAAGCAGRSSRVLWMGAAGRLSGPGSGAAETSTIYDLASLTKVIATTSCVMRLVDAGAVSPGTPVCSLLPEFRGGGREAVTIEHLLTHSAGLPAWRPLYREARGRDEVLAAVLATPLERRPGEVESYSDLGAILLGECAARAGGAPLATLSWRLVFEPLGMRDTCFRPPASQLGRIAPTEDDKAFRGRLVHGEVHDENAFAMGGVAGHAGLFSTAEDLARFAVELLRGVREGRSSLFAAATARFFTTRRGLVTGSSRALGWDTRADAEDGSGPPGSRSSSGRKFTAGSFGHTGFTGTSIWFDPGRDRFAVLLTNQVHPTRNRPGMGDARRTFHDAVADAIDSAGQA
jgi:CubicO group peptidase (beta-lactamase class C family)